MCGRELSDLKISKFFFPEVHHVLVYIHAYLVRNDVRCVSFTILLIDKRCVCPYDIQIIWKIWNLNWWNFQLQPFVIWRNGIVLAHIRHQDIYLIFNSQETIEMKSINKFWNLKINSKLVEWWYRIPFSRTR